MSNATSNAYDQLHLHWFDYASAVVWFSFFLRSFFQVVFILAVGITVKSWRGQENNVYSYFLGGRTAPWWVVGFSLFSYGTGVEYAMGMTKAGYTDGIAAGIFMWGSIPPLLGLAYFFLKEYRELDIITLPTFLFKPFDGTTRLIFSIFTLLLSVMRIAIALHSYSILLEGLLGYNTTATKLVMIIVIEVYVVTGGLKAVMQTEVMQSVLLIVFSLVLSIKIIHDVGGIETLKSNLSRNQTRLFQSASDDTYPWPGVVFGFPIEAMVLWSCNQVITQKALAAEDDYHAKMGCIFCCFLNLLPPFLFVIPGMALQVDRPHVNPSDAYEVLIEEYMPSGTRGFLLAALTCSLATSIASVLSACTAILTIDVLEHLNLFRHARTALLQENKNLAGRLGTLLVALAGFSWSYAVPSVASNQWDYILSSSIFSAAVFAAFLSAYLFGGWWSMKSAAVTGMLALGLVMGLLRMVLDEMKISGRSLPGGVSWYVDVNFFLLTAGLFVVYMSGMLLATRLIEHLEWSSNMVQLEPDAMTEIGDTLPESEAGEPTEVCSILTETHRKGAYDDIEDDFEGTVVASEIYDAQRDKYRLFATNAMACLALIAFLIILAVWF